MEDAALAGRRASLWRFITTIVLCGCMAGCATRASVAGRDEETVRGAMEEPLRDLSVWREAPPALLTEAADDPFSLPAEPDCQALAEEIVALNAILGPDIDAPRNAGDDGFSATELLAGAVGGVWSLPYRGIVRRMTGADRRDRELRHAILAGMVRRGFLKGVALRAGCGALRP